MKVIDRQNGLVVKMNRNFVSFILSRARSIRSKVGPLDLPGSFLDRRRRFVHSESLDNHRLKRRLQIAVSLFVSEYPYHFYNSSIFPLSND